MDKTVRVTLQMTPERAALDREHRADATDETLRLARVLQRAAFYDRPDVLTPEREAFPAPCYLGQAMACQKSPQLAVRLIGALEGVLGATDLPSAAVHTDREGTWNLVEVTENELVYERRRPDGQGREMVLRGAEVQFPRVVMQYQNRGSPDFVSRKVVSRESVDLVRRYVGPEECARLTAKTGRVHLPGVHVVRRDSGDGR